MSLDDAGEIFLEAVEHATNMARSIGQSPAEIARRSRSRAWIFGQLKKRATDFGVPEDTIRKIVESLAKAKLSEEIPDLLPGQRDRGIDAESFEESSHPVWVKRAQDLADIAHTPRSMFELQALTKRLWGWPASLVVNVAEIAERLELVEYCNPPQWQRRKPEQMAKKPRTREQTIMHMLPVALTETDRVKAMNGRAALLNEKREIEDEAKASRRDYARRLGEVDAKLERADAKVRSGHEIKQVACREVTNLDDATFTIIRLDTLDEIEARPLTEDERQLTLEDVADAAPPVAAVG